jgi:SAM-dependent methyltransferase
MAADDRREFWERRLSRDYSLEGVGWAGMGEPFNAWMYRVRRHVFLRALRPLLSEPAGLSALDVGAGTGFYVDRWHELGVSAVTGTDITETAVERLTARYPAETFLRVDIGAEDPPLAPGSFDVASAMDVLFHIVDDTRFARAFANLARLLKPGGLLAFSDNFLHTPEQRVSHQSSRSLADVEAVVRAAGFDVLDRVPMFALLNTPLDSSSRTLHASWRVLQTLCGVHPALGGAAAAALYPLELALVTRLREGPSTELMLCRRAR